MVSEEQEDLRIDRYLAEACEELSRSYIQKLLKSQDVLVNGSPVKASYKVAAGDQIEVEVPEAIEPEIAAEEMDLDILYEDQDVILINKPKGMVVHPAAGTTPELWSMASWPTVRTNFPGSTALCVLVSFTGSIWTPPAF